MVFAFRAAEVVLSVGIFRTQLIHQAHHLKEPLHVGHLHRRFLRRRRRRQRRGGDGHVEPVGKLIDRIARQQRRKRFHVLFDAGTSVLLAHGFAEGHGTGKRGRSGSLRLDVVHDGTSLRHDMPRARFACGAHTIR